MTVPAMGYGCMGLNHNRSQHPPREMEIALIHEAIERSVTLFDTAESYGYHINEKLVGEALKGYTDRVFVSFKFGHKFVNGVQVKTEEDSTPANIRRAHSVCHVTAIQSEYHLMHRAVETSGPECLCRSLCGPVRQDRAGYIHNPFTGRWCRLAHTP